MDAIDILMSEHVYIKKVISAIKNDCIKLVDGGEVDIEFYRKTIDFVRNFADKYHHQKEEDRLFNIISDKNPILKNGPIMGMLLEHDIGRSYIRNLEEALNKYEEGDRTQKAYIVANALSYGTLLENHIEKEDTAIYMMARNQLDTEILKTLDKEFERIEMDNANNEIRNKYISFANNL